MAECTAAAPERFRYCDLKESRFRRMLWDLNCSCLKMRRLRSTGSEGAAEEAVTIRQGHGGYGYEVAALVCFVVFADNGLRHMEGQQETMFLWVTSGRWETIVVFGMFSVIMQVLFWSKIVDSGNHRTRGE